TSRQEPSSRNNPLGVAAHPARTTKLGARSTCIAGSRRARSRRTSPPLSWLGIHSWVSDKSDAGYTGQCPYSVAPIMTSVVNDWQVPRLGQSLPPTRHHLSQSPFEQTYPGAHVLSSLAQAPAPTLFPLPPQQSVVGPVVDTRAQVTPGPQIAPGFTRSHWAVQ